MPQYVYIGNGTSRVCFDLEPFKNSPDQTSGGQGVIYFTADKRCLKIMHNPADSEDELEHVHSIIVSKKSLYDNVAAVSAVPLEMIWDGDKDTSQIIGYSMEKLEGYQSLNQILTEEDSRTHDIDLHAAGLILEALCRTVRLIHAQGFVIGDFNPSNVLFRRDGNRFAIRVIDVDSWAFRCKDSGCSCGNYSFSSDVLDTALIYHPDFVRADREKKPRPEFTERHDWWAFALISWIVLTKYDPFMKGLVGEADREDRILNGDTSFRAVSVRLTTRCGPPAQALGPKLRSYLDRCLRLKAQRPFPTKLLSDFAGNLLRCSKCGFTAHKTAVICPSCGKLLA